MGHAYKFTDGDLLDWLDLRRIGFSCVSISKKWDATDNYIRAATGRVVREDARHHEDKITFPKPTK
jgi:hypothetical protein